MSGHRFMISQTSNAGAELAAAKRQERAAVLGCPAGTVPARNVLNGGSRAGHLTRAERRFCSAPPSEQREQVEKWNSPDSESLPCVSSPEPLPSLRIRFV
jgi:hypothetical protein